MYAIRIEQVVVITDVSIVMEVFTNVNEERYIYWLLCEYSLTCYFKGYRYSTKSTYCNTYYNNISIYIGVIVL